MWSTAATKRTTHGSDKADEDEKQDCSEQELKMLDMQDGSHQPRLMRPRDLVRKDQARPIFCPILWAWLSDTTGEVRLVQSDEGRRRKNPPTQQAGV